MRALLADDRQGQQLSESMNQREKAANTRAYTHLGVKTVFRKRAALLQSWEWIAMLCILHYEDWDNAASYAFCSQGAKQCDILARNTEEIILTCAETSL